jgi:hypothetical protein
MVLKIDQRRSRPDNTLLYPPPPSLPPFLLPSLLSYLEIVKVELADKGGEVPMAVVAGQDLVF